MRSGMTAASKSCVLLAFLREAPIIRKQSRKRTGCSAASAAPLYASTLHLAAPVQRLNPDGQKLAEFLR